MYANKYGVCQNANYPLTSSSKGKTVNILPLWTTNKLLGNSKKNEFWVE